MSSTTNLFGAFRVKHQCQLNDFIKLINALKKKTGPNSYNLIWTYLDFHNLSFLIVLGFNDTSTLMGHFVSSPREREKRDRRDSRRDEREGQGRKRNRNESEETEEIKTSPPYPYLLQG